MRNPPPRCPSQGCPLRCYEDTEVLGLLGLWVLVVWLLSRSSSSQWFHVVSSLSLSVFSGSLRYPNLEEDAGQWSVVHKPHRLPSRPTEAEAPGKASQNDWEALARVITLQMVSSLCLNLLSEQTPGLAERTLPAQGLGWLPAVGASTRPRMGSLELLGQHPTVFECLVLSSGRLCLFCYFIFLNLRNKWHLKYTPFRKGPVDANLQSEHSPAGGVGAHCTARRWVPAGLGSAPRTRGSTKAPSSPWLSSFELREEFDTYFKTVIFKLLRIMRNVTTARMSHTCRTRKRVWFYSKFSKTY